MVLRTETKILLLDFLIQQLHGTQVDTKYQGDIFAEQNYGVLGDIIAER